MVLLEMMHRTYCVDNASLFDNQMIVFIMLCLSPFKRSSCAVMFMAGERQCMSQNEREIEKESEIDIVNIRRIRI